MIAKEFFPMYENKFDNFSFLERKEETFSISRIPETTEKTKINKLG
jgi:hypothetical protein